MSKLYKNMRKEDLPVYVCYYSAKARLCVVSKPLYINEMLASGMTQQEIADEALRINHAIYNNFICPALERKKKRK